MKSPLLLVLHEWFQKLPPFTLRLTNFVLYLTCEWRTVHRKAAHINPLLLIVVDIEQSHNFGAGWFSLFAISRRHGAQAAMNAPRSITRCSLTMRTSRRSLQIR